MADRTLKKFRAWCRRIWRALPTFTATVISIVLMIDRVLDLLGRFQS